MVMKERLLKKEGITLIALVITIIVLLILAGVTIATLTGDNGILTRASDAKIETALGAVKEALRLEQGEKVIDNKNLTPEILLSEGKVSRTVQQGEEEKYYMYYAIKENAYEGMQGLGKGNIASLKDVFLIDDKLNVKYIASNGKEYGDNINNKILDDETDIRFSSKEFSEYISKISGVTEDEMKFKWMKNQTSLTISDPNITSLEDLVFFPNLQQLYLGEHYKEPPQITTLNGVENCPKLTTINIVQGPDKDYTALKYLTNLTTFSKYGGNDFNNIIDALKSCINLENVSLRAININSMKRISELRKLKSLNLENNIIDKIEGLEEMISLENLVLSGNKISKIEGLEKLSNLQRLDLTNNNISDITPLSENTSLSALDLKANPEIDGDRNNYTGERLVKLNKIGEILDRGGTINLDVDKLRLFTNYKRINLVGQKLSTLEPLEGLTQLTSLVMYNNQLTLEDEKSQEILENMTNLTELNLMNNNITDVTAINSLEKLKNLNLGGTGNNINLKEMEDIISNLDSLAVSTESLKTIVNCDVNKITRLIVGYSNITEIPDLSKFTKLRELSLYSNNNIADLSTISKLANLEILNLGQTNLHGRMIDFSKLNNLTNLNLVNNTLWDEDLESLKVLSGNTNLTINLWNNSIINATALLELNPNTRINLSGNVNLTKEAKENLKGHFQERVTF